MLFLIKLKYAHNGNDESNKIAPQSNIEMLKTVKSLGAVAIYWQFTVLKYLLR